MEIDSKKTMSPALIFLTVATWFCTRLIKCSCPQLVAILGARENQEQV